MKRFFLLLVSGILAFPVLADSFKVDRGQFLLNGQPFVIRSGEMHFDRIPREYWEHRILMAKAMGLNTIATYIFWNKVEPRPDCFDEQELQDMIDFVRLVKKHGMWLILRPGPYTCAEWEMGGLPWWLLKDENMELRSQHPYFLERSRKYLRKIGNCLSSMQVTKGGPIIMVQVENEYGHYGTDTIYLGKIRDYILEAGFTEIPLFQCDFFQKFNDVRSDLIKVVNFGSKIDYAKAFDALEKIQPGGPYMAGEYYSGWLDHWGEKHQETSSDQVIKGLTYMLKNGYSYSMYMVHGGSSFGMSAGANFDRQKSRYQPTVSSYDYNAPISEAGWDTPKYYEIRSAILPYLQPGEILPAPPTRMPVMAIPEFDVNETALVFKNLPPPIRDSKARNMEAYDQGFGYIVYSTNISRGCADSLIFDDIRDYAQIYMDGRLIATLNRMLKQNCCVLPARNKEVKIDILVEAMGRINSTKYIHDRKGIIGTVRFGKAELTNWEVYPFPLSNNHPPYGLTFGQETASQPAYYRATFTLDNVADTFLDMRNWGKGLVWINGRCLGRFWNIGPTQTMYLPAPWLHKGINEIIILDFVGPIKTSISGIKDPILASDGSEDARFVVF